jgi:hypothetical protein
MSINYEEELYALLTAAHKSEAEGNWDEAEMRFLKAFDFAAAQLGSDHVCTGNAAFHLAAFYARRREYLQSDMWKQRAREIIGKLLGW